MNSSDRINLLIVSGVVSVTVILALGCVGSLVVHGTVPAELSTMAMAGFGGLIGLARGPQHPGAQVGNVAQGDVNVQPVPEGQG